MDRLTSFRESGRRYPALRVIGFLCTVIGAALMTGGGFMLIYTLYTLSTVSGGAAPPANPIRGEPVLTLLTPWLMVGGISLIWSFGILYAGLQLIALGAFLQLMIHVEENTRASAQMLDRLRTRLEASPEGGDAVFRS